MKVAAKPFRMSIYVRLLLATLLPLVLIFSAVLAIISTTFLNSSAGVARDKTQSFARQSALQVRSGFVRVSGLTELTAKDLALVAGDSDAARESARQILKNTLENSPNAYRIRMHFPPGPDAFGAEGPFAHVYYRQDGEVVGFPLVVAEQPDADIAAPWYDVPLKTGRPHHESVSHGRFNRDDDPVYVGTTNYPVIRDGRVIGCVGMGMLYRRSFQFVDAWEADGSYRLLIVSEDGTILYASDETLIDRNLAALGFEDGLLAGMTTAMRDNRPFLGEGHSPLFGQESLVCLYPVDLPVTTTRVFMYMDTPTKLVYAEANAAVRTVVAVFLAGLLLFAASLLAATRNIVKPVKALTENADLIANGRLDVVLNTFDGKRGARHEVDSLERSLTKMLVELTQANQLKIAAVEAEYERRKLAEAAETKDRFFANMSHEIRTPMNIILGMAEILIADGLTDRQRKYVQDIRVASESLLDIINDILDLSRLESGNFSLSPAHYDFRALVENIGSLGRYLAEKKGLEFRVETEGAAPDFLYGDDARLRQVLLNIIGNAVKFTEKGSVVLTIADEGRTLRFDVADTGAGIRAEDRPHLFEPFKQFGAAGGRRTAGSGLGLSITRNLVDLMGGAIAVDSEYGRGSVFRITIPKVPGDRGQIEDASDVLPVEFDPASRVLAVDDSEINLRVAQGLLKLFGIAVDTALSGAEALEMLARTDYDLVFMDHMMPEMDGIETTKRIRAQGGRLAKLPVIAVTANAAAGARESFLAAGMDDFLPKPVERLKLQAILAKWMPANRVLRENRYGSGARYRFRSALVARIGGGANDADSADIVARTSTLEELDVRIGLSRVAGNRALYEELLGMAVEAVPRTLERIDAARRADDASRLRIEVHGLKGTLANVGAMNLSGGVAELEKTGIDAAGLDRFDERFAPLRREMEVFVQKLRGLVSRREGAAHPRLEPERDRTLENELPALREALTHFDYERSLEIVSGLSRYDWGEAGNQDLGAIQAHIKYFDYEAALDAIGRLFPVTSTAARPSPKG